jgi:hypothetical protein
MANKVVTQPVNTKTSAVVIPVSRTITPVVVSPKAGKHTYVNGVRTS